MISDDILEVVNHEVWFEFRNGLVLKWGHYPDVDGRLDPLCITRAFSLANGKVMPVFVGLDRSIKDGLFVEFEGEAVAVEYDRGIYSLTSDGRWIFGRKVPLNRSIEEMRHILGFAKVHLDNEVKALGLELEMDLDGGIEGGRVEVLFRGESVDTNVKLRNAGGAFEVKTGEKVEFAKGVNVLSARFVDDLGFIKRGLVTTLTILI